MPPEPSPAFAAIKGRYLLLCMVATILVASIPYIVFVPDQGSVATTAIADAIGGIALYAILCLLLLIICWRKGILSQLSLGTRPGRRQTWLYLALGIPMVGTAIFGLFVIYLPLSYVAPGFVTSWLLNSPPVVWWQPNTQTLIASGINIIVLVIIAPIVEEVFFRGFLFNRLWQKYTLGTAVLLSSLAFAVLHADPLGAFLFGAVMALTYARTNSLIGPILIHVSNNAIIVAVLLAEGAATGEIANWTLAEFQSDWWIAMLGAVIGVPWIAWYFWTYLREAVDLASARTAARQTDVELSTILPSRSNPTM